MKIETTFSIGDSGYVYSGDGAISKLTIGQVRVEADKTGVHESYMCKETGVGSGIVYRINETIFTTEEACAEAFKSQMESEKAAKERWRLQEIEWAKRELAVAQEKLASLTG